MAKSNKQRLLRHEFVRLHKSFHSELFRSLIRREYFGERTRRLFLNVLNSFVVKRDKFRSYELRKDWKKQEVLLRHGVDLHGIII